MKLLQRPALVGAVIFMVGLGVTASAAACQGRRNEGRASEQFDFLAGQVAAAVTARIRTGECDTAAGAGTVVAAGRERRLAVPIFGRVRAAEIRATPADVQSLRQTPPADVALVVALIGTLCALLAGVMTRLANLTRSERLEQARRAVIVESSDDAIVGQTLDGIITDWNAGAERLFGYPASEALGRSAASLLLTAGRTAEELEIRSAIGRGERLAPFETTRLHRDGSWVDVSITAAPIRRAAGSRPVAFVATIRDIRPSQQARRTSAEVDASLEHQIAERTLELGTALHDLRAIVDALPSMIGYWDDRLINRVANRAYAEWFDRDIASVPGTGMLEFLGAAHFERTRSHIEAALRGEPQRFERTVARPGGLPQHLVVHYLPDVRDSRVHGFCVLVHDITELIEGRLELAAVQRDSEALLRTIEQYAIVTVSDASGRITEVNELLCAISGYRPEELVGLDHRILNSGHHEPGFWSDMWRTVTSGKAWRGEVCNRARNGSRYWVNSIVAPFVAADGTVEKYISIQHDMTAAKQVEERLRSSEAFLDRAGRIAGVGGWELDLATQALTWSAQTCRIHEVSPDYRPDVESAIRFYAPEARAVIEAAVACGLRDGKPWDIELPLLTATGRAIWVRSVGTAEFEAGEPARLIGAFQDVTERRRAEALLAHERQLMESLLDNLPDQIYFKDRESRFLRVNPALATRLGLASTAAALGKSDADFFTAEHARETRAVELQILESGEPVLGLEEQQLWPDRAPTWNSTTKMLLRDAGGGVIGTFGISRDISARRRLEDDLQRNNQRFSLAAESVGLGVWERDLVTGTLVWDERMQALFGQEAATAPEADCSAVWRAGVHPDDVERCQQELQAAIDGSRPLDTSFRVVLPNREIRHLKAAAHVLRDARGGALRMTGVSFDVTEHILAENVLRDTMAMLNAVLDSATQASIVVCNIDGIITVFNKGAERLFGYSSSELVGRESPFIFLDRDDMRERALQMSAELGRKVRAGQVLVDPELLGRPQQWNHRCKDGSIIPMSLAVTVMRGEDGAPRGYLGIGHDISQQQQQERQLREAVEKANDANRAKSQFLTRMSHEIRTPMNAVIGLSWVLERTPLDPLQSATLGKIKVASRSLLNIINDILDLSKIEAAHMSLEHAPFSLATLLRELHELMSVAAEEKGIVFAVEASAAPADLWLQGDATRLHQVLSNLVSNAIKFTERGSVRLRVEPVTDAASATTGVVRLRFNVQDTGIGITPEALTRLFSPFVQADETTTRRFGGTGLGLSIVKQMVELMGGSVGVRSQPGHGSEFWAEIEFALAAAGTLPTPTQTQTQTQTQTPAAAMLHSAHRLEGVRVLLVDDNAINLEVARCMLEFEGANVRLAQSALEAIDYLSTTAAAVDVVLMDVQMPVLDGLDATRRIRSDLGLTRLPIIALTAGNSSTEHAGARAAGMDDLVSKPFELDTLVDCILRQVGAGAAPYREPLIRPVAAALPEGWPVIAGIDSLDVALRLRGDLALFRSMLQRLLGTFGDIAGESDFDPDTSPPRAARLHDLKGSAGTLGARRIQRLAAAAEVACRAGDTPTVARRTRQLAHALRALADAAGGYLQTVAEPLAAPAAPWDPEPVDVLLRQLGRFDLAAVDGFAALAPRLQQRLGLQAFGLLNQDMSNLDFSAAARLLKPLLGVEPKTPEERGETVPTV